MNPVYICLILLFMYTGARGQLYTVDGAHSYGLGSNITLGLHLSQVKKFAPYIEANINAGYLYQGNWIGVTPQVQYAFKWNTFSTSDRKAAHQLFMSLQVPISLYHGICCTSLHSVLEYNQPFYAFADLSMPAIKNPYRSAISLGVQDIRIFHPSERVKLQRVGTIHLKIREVHVFYQNDGVLPGLPVDNHDRWYTSSAMVAWHRNGHRTVDHYALAYNRFTGYSHLSYEAAKVIGDNHVNYKDLSEIKYNEDYWRFTVGHNHIGNINLRLTNPNFKLMQGQKAIHFFQNMPYHIDNSSPRLSIDVQSQVFISNHLKHEDH